jgi:hypothetical protein
MELVARKADLVRELQFFQQIVERKNTIPILANVLIEATGNEMTLLATDLEVTLRSRAEAQSRATAPSPCRPRNPRWCGPTRWDVNIERRRAARCEGVWRQFVHACRRCRARTSRPSPAARGAKAPQVPPSADDREDAVCVTAKTRLLNGALRGQTDDDGGRWTSWRWLRPGSRQG